MKVLYWTPEFHPEIGGIEEISRCALPLFRRRNYEFMVVAAHGRLRLPDVTDFDGIPVRRFHFRQILGGRDCRAILLCRRQIAELKKSFAPDLVHYHFGDPYGYFHVTTHAAHPVPSLVTLHSIPGSPVTPHTLLGALLTQASWVVGASAATLAEPRRALPAIVERSSVIYNALEPVALAPAPLNFDRPRILCLGRMVEEKGFDVAVAAFRGIHERFPGSRLIMAGDGVAHRALERLVRALRLAEFVEFLGWVQPDGIAGLINAATIVVIPSRVQESFPLVALQAAQMGRPVVAARVGGLPESIVDGETGMLVEKEDPNQLAQAVRFLLENPGLAAAYGRTARARVHDMFSLTAYVDAYDRLYHRLVENARGGLAARAVAGAGAIREAAG